MWECPKPAVLHGGLHNMEAGVRRPPTQGGMMGRFVWGLREAVSIMTHCCTTSCIGYLWSKPIGLARIVFFFFFLIRQMCAHSTKLCAHLSRSLKRGLCFVTLVVFGKMSAHFLGRKNNVETARLKLLQISCSSMSSQNFISEKAKVFSVA